jgi:hypothetical protein
VLLLSLEDLLLLLLLSFALSMLLFLYRVVCASSSSNLGTLGLSIQSRTGNTIPSATTQNGFFTNSDATVTQLLMLLNRLLLSIRILLV